MTSIERNAGVKFYADPARLCRDSEPDIELDPPTQRELSTAFEAFLAGTLTSEQALTLCSAAEAGGPEGLFVHRDDLVTAGSPPSSEKNLASHHPTTINSSRGGEPYARRGGR